MPELTSIPTNLSHRELDLTELYHYCEDFLASYPNGLALGLSGELGSGKTTFVRSCIDILCRRRGIKTPKVISPSFVVRVSYCDISPIVEHFDLYRFEKARDSDLTETGYFEAHEKCQRQKGYLFVEWPEHADAEFLGLSAVMTIQIKATRRVFYITPGDKAIL